MFYIASPCNEKCSVTAETLKTTVLIQKKMLTNASSQTHFGIT